MTAKAWKAVLSAAEAAKSRSIAGLFEDDTRAERYSLVASDMLFDYSKTALDDTARETLIQLAHAAGVEDARRSMFTGEKINASENRAALHTALRNLNGPPVFVDGVDVMPDLRETFERMKAFAKMVRDGRIAGQGGAITDVINIGIGGSDLGPAMAVRALTPYHDGPRCHFVSNVDGADLADTLSNLAPETTLVIVSSKTFTTIETMTNASSVQKWMARSVTDPSAQFAAVSTAKERTAAFGIPTERVFGFADWVGGRYSIWGPIGLSLMIAIGAERFGEFLEGGARMDAHFATTALDRNMPAMLALIGIWHHQGMGYPTRAVLPYEHRLSRLPAYLQQLEMESNGKSVGVDGEALSHGGGPIVWGEPGTNGQHAFFQLLHQGNQIVPCEFLIASRGHEPELTRHHELLQANCLAQSEALMCGRDLEETLSLFPGHEMTDDDIEKQARQRVFPGNRPSVTLAYPKLTPRILGQIIALYEHRVFVEGVILGLNSFDQWGVELGKEIAKSLFPVFEEREPTRAQNGSTRLLASFLTKQSEDI
ncbi:glucose-6-phosphate isomerase [Marimonas lutisalis]|uniref:glucose-6-phosphate isomerase n=1 Tax=Marimonas lutisalis TaxID=2545756 RepID=UPI0010F8EAB8|nr:glucose-6-phosphate isomerase [Marimonas lutisalis]